MRPPDITDPQPAHTFGPFHQGTHGNLLPVVKSPPVTGPCGQVCQASWELSPQERWVLPWQRPGAPPRAVAYWQGARAAEPLTGRSRCLGQFVSPAVALATPRTRPLRWRELPRPGGYRCSSSGFAGSGNRRRRCVPRWLDCLTSGRRCTGRRYAVRAADPLEKIEGF